MKTTIIIICTILIAFGQAPEPQPCNCHLYDAPSENGLDKSTYKCEKTAIQSCKFAVNQDNSKCALCDVDTAMNDYPATECKTIPADKLITNCLYYNHYQNQYMCIVCKPGFSTGNHLNCNPEIKNCEDYEMVGTTMKCQLCEGGYELKAEACNEKKVENCEEYEESVSTNCAKCEKDYYLKKKSQCEKRTYTDANCDEFELKEDQCLECMVSYYIKDGKCEKGIDKCVMHSSDGSKCEACEGIVPSSDQKTCDQQPTEANKDVNCWGYLANGKCGKCKLGWGADKNKKCTVECPKNAGGRVKTSDSQIMTISALISLIFISLIF